MKSVKFLCTPAIILALASAVWGQENKQAAGNTPREVPASEVAFPEEGRAMIEVGGRTLWGDVYGRRDLPFEPRLRTSKLNEYTDLRRNVLLRRARINLDDLFGSSLYLNYQTQSSFYRNQSHLATFGDWNRFKLQVRYDETPHIFTNTSRTLYSESAPGVYTIPLSIRQALQTASSTGTAAQIANTLPSFVASQIIPAATFLVPRLKRQAITGLFSYNLTPDWNVDFYVWDEHQTGTRPIGAFLYSSPSASASTQPGTVANRQSPASGAEVPEPIDYRTNVFQLATEYGRSRWAFQAGYEGSFFKSDVKSLRFDAPFATEDIPVQIIPPGAGCSPTAPAVNCAISATPAHGEMALYPDNRAHHVKFAGAIDAGKYLRIMASTSTGWLRQDDAFLPYTANTAITGLGPLPASNLGGDRQTLAMNWTAVSRLGSKIEFDAKYRHYDYNNNTPVFALTPIQGDVIGANSTATGQAAPGATDTQGRSNPGFNRKTLELSGRYDFADRSAFKVGYEADWFDRSHRDVHHSLEHSVFANLDFSPTRDLLFRISGRRQDREPEEYQSELAVDPATGAEISCTSTSPAFTEEHRCLRRFDEASRILYRGDVMVQYDLQQFSFGGAFQTIQSDFNRRGGANSPTPLNFLSGTTRPYYLYGALNDLSWIYTFDATYAFSPAFSAFAEYSRELYHKRMVSRNRSPVSGTQDILTCTGCDSANNDWESTARDVFDTYAVGLDFFFGGRVWFSPYYSLAAGKSNIHARALGNPTITTGRDRFALTGTTTPENYPQSVTRIHEMSAVFKFRIRENITPKIEYRLQQFDNRDFQTTPMTPYMGCVGAGAIVVGPPCVNVGPTLLSKSPSSFYPGFVVGDTAAARFLFLGADQPSYRAHILTATLEFRF